MTSQHDSWIIMQYPQDTAGLKALIPLNYCCYAGAVLNIMKSREHPSFMLHGR